MPATTSSKANDTGLERHDIADEAGDWCGTIVLDSEWVSEWEERKGTSIEEAKFEFLAISDAKRFTTEECETWTYYIPKEREESEWDVYYVLLTDRPSESSNWKRIALGKVFKTGFDNAVPGRTWKEIVLG